MKGVYPKIQSQYSQELASVIKSLLQVTPSARPSAAKLLSSSVVQKQASELNLDLDDFDEPHELLKTIRVPKNLHYLTDRLPKPNYTGEKNSSMGKIRFTEHGADVHAERSLLPKIDSLHKEQGRPAQKKRRNPGLSILEIEGHSKIIQESRSLQPKNPREEQHYVNLKQAYNLRHRSRRAELLPSSKNISLPSLHS